MHRLIISVEIGFWNYKTLFLLELSRRKWIGRKWIFFLNSLSKKQNKKTATIWGLSFLQARQSESNSRHVIECWNSIELQNASKNAMNPMASRNLLVFVTQKNTLIDSSGAGKIVMIGLGLWEGGFVLRWVALIWPGVLTHFWHTMRLGNGNAAASSCSLLTQRVWESYHMQHGACANKCVSILD